MKDLTRRKKELLNSYNNLCSCYGDIISEQTKTINQLKELLKECKRYIDFWGYTDSHGNFLYPQIENAIGENNGRIRKHR